MFYKRANSTWFIPPHHDLSGKKWCVPATIGFLQMPQTLTTVPCLSIFQRRMTGCGRAAFPTSVARYCSKPSTTCWSAASWTAALFASASGSSNPMRRTRSQSTRGTWPDPFTARMFVSSSCAWTCSYVLWGLVLLLSLSAASITLINWMWSCRVHV